MLVWGADRFVLGAAGCAKGFGISPLIIGLTIVGFGTSAPEMLVSSLAAFEGSPGMSVGNALGSNITNVALVLGIATIVRPLTVHRKVMAIDTPILLGVMGLTMLLLYDGDLDRLDGGLLLTGLFVMIGLVVRQGIKEKADPEGLEDLPEDMTTKRAVQWLVSGLVVLLIGAKILVEGAVFIAEYAGVESSVIGLTVVAFGTSLPELAATVVAARRNEHDIAVGNIIGSNLFNTLGVLGLPGIIHPGPIEESVLTRDGPVMLGVLALFWLLALAPKRGRVGRFGGVVLCAAFAAHLGWVAVETMETMGNSAPPTQAEAGQP